MKKRLRIGMIGGGIGGQVGKWHRHAMSLDNKYELVAGCFSSNIENGINSANELGIDLSRNYPDFETMATKESEREDGIQVVSIVTPNHLHAQPSIKFLSKNINVICDKPLTATMDQAKDLYNAVKKSNAHFFLTHNYSGYPVIREMRRIIKDGLLGKIRVIRGGYLQGWLGSKEEESNKQAQWRTDPARSGVAGCVGDIGSHIMHLAEFVTNTRVKEVAADLTTFVEGRMLDDNASILIRMEDGSKGNLSVSQVAIGEENNITLSIYGEKGALHWVQENPNYAKFSQIGELDKVITRGSVIQTSESMGHTRIPPGHPEAFIEAFAQIYSDAADVIQNKDNKDELLKVLPNIDDGLHIMKFINATVDSSNKNSKWINLSVIN